VKRCFIGLGANLGKPFATLGEAAAALEQLESTQAAGRSAIYRSAAIGPDGQPDYLNAVVAIDTRLSPLALLDELQALEHAAGRRRELRWGPRTLDLDLLLYGHLELQSERLSIPHPRIFERNFVLQPLADLLADDWQFNDGTSLGERLAACPANPLERTALSWEAVSGRCREAAGL
jgi:2-amino-4-hydroxy-6-hydroxymethyldihydropteridine diphosphokinase